MRVASSRPPCGACCTRHCIEVGKVVFNSLICIVLLSKNFSNSRD
jgi:hypothetical protein